MKKLSLFINYVFDKMLKIKSCRQQICSPNSRLEAISWRRRRGHRRGIWVDDIRKEWPNGREGSHGGRTEDDQRAEEIKMSHHHSRSPL